MCAHTVHLATWVAAVHFIPCVCTLLAGGVLACSTIQMHNYMGIPDEVLGFVGRFWYTWAEILYTQVAAACLCL